MIKFGRVKSYRDVTLDDHLKYLVWTFAHGDGRHDEESEKPIVSTQEVTREIIDHQLIVPVITIKAEAAEVFGTAWYLHREREIFAISIWEEGRWKTLGDVTSLVAPLVLVSVPKILGVSAVRFQCNALREEKAVRIS